MPCCDDLYSKVFLHTHTVTAQEPSAPPQRQEAPGRWGLYHNDCFICRAHGLAGGTQ